MRIIGMLLFVVFMAIIIEVPMEKSDMPALNIVLGGIPAVLLLAFGRDMGGACKAIFTKTRSAANLQNGIAVIERGKTFAIAWGVLVMLVIQEHILLNMDDPKVVVFDVARSFAIPVCSALIAYVGFAPLVVSLRRRLQAVS